MGSRCTVTRVTDAAQWEALFSRVEHPHMVQTWAYGEARQAAGGGWDTRRYVLDAGGWRPRRLVFERGDEPVAICQLFDKSLAGLRWASRLNRGPLFLDDAPGDDVVRDVYGALARRRGRGCEVLVLAPALAAGPENRRLLAELGFRDRGKRGWRSFRVDLRLDEEQLRKNLSHRWRNRLKAAERSDLTLKVSQSWEDVEWLIARHVQNMRDKGFAGPSPALIRAFCQAAPDDFVVVQARLGDGAVAGALVHRFGGGAEFSVGWFGQEGRKVHVGNFLYWRTALELQRRGCAWLDLGGYEASAGYGSFKASMGAAPYELLNEWLAV
jgi:hypothetical protein